LLNLLNPVTPFVVATRDLVVEGRLSQPGFFAAGCAISLFVFFAAWRIFHLTEPRIAERI
ncbi:MAG TPA: hypothetical protein VGS41_08335, partial [Chthonomonadales bacterium]|nr:hypothetical protein [Chthonomonadales bacterium]